MLQRRSDFDLKIAVIGAGSWGTAIAGMLGSSFPKVMLWARSNDSALDIQNERENLKYLPGVALPGSVFCSNDIELVVKDAELIVLATPSHAVRTTAETIANFVAKEAIIVTVAKGLELSTLLRMSEVIATVIPSLSKNIAVLSGPNHAEEVGAKQPTTSVVAAHSREVAELVQDALKLPYFRVYTNPDVIGVELAGALKNIIALGVGIVEGLGFGDNTKAALMTRGLAEITRLGIAMGAQPLTFAGLAGVGDLIATCTSRHSRNRNAGILLAQGKTISEIEAETSMVVEGVRATMAAHKLAHFHGVEMPIMEQIFSVLYDNRSPQAAVLKLMDRERTHEMEDVVEKKEW